MNFEFEDWVELYNATASPINLAGWTLSDKASNPTKWTFPGGTVPANGYLIVFASGRDQIIGGEVHAGFKLTQTKPEEIVLSNPAGNIIDQLTMDPAQKDHARARVTDGSPTWGLDVTPTPGASNTSVMTGYATMPIFDQQAGFYTGSVTLNLSTPDPNVTIHYTTDGSEPTLASPTYATPLTYSAITVVRARAFSSDPNIAPSFIETNTYFFGVSHNMAVLSISGDDILDLLNGTQFDPEGVVEFFDENQQFIDEAVGNFNKHGNDSWAYDQRGLDFITRDQFGYTHSIEHQIYRDKNRDEFQRLMLKAGSSDNYPFATTFNGLPGTHIRDPFIQSLSQVADLRMDERTYEPCIMYVNGQYWGLYELREKVDDPDFTDHYYDQDKNNIDIMKYWGGLNVDWGTDADWNDLYNFILNNPMSVQANYDSAKQRLNMGSLIDYVIFNTYIVNTDWLNWNSMWWRGKDPDGDKKKWRYALWDQDNTFNLGQDFTGWGNTGSDADPCNPQNNPNLLNLGPEVGHMDILNALFESPEFEADYINRYADLLNGYLSCDFVLGHLDSILAIVTPEMPAQIARWGGTMQEWEDNVDFLRDQITARCAFIDSGIVGCYDVEGPYNIIVDVEPAGAGDVRISTTTPTAYSYSADYFGGIPIEFRATANAGFEFDYWETINHAPTPNVDTTRMEINLNTTDSVIAHFKAVAVVVDPPDLPGPTPQEDFLLELPNAFSPNGDGNNDILYPIASAFSEMSLEVYNRWGEMVFKTDNPAKGWDGTFNGKRLNSGVFAYSLTATFTDGSFLRKSGNITLMR